LQSKISAYIGFAVKSGNAVFGVDALERFKGKIYLIIFSSDMADNSLKKAAALAEKFSAPMISGEKNAVEEAAHKINCKLVAIKDKNLSEAILKTASENDKKFKLYFRGGELT